MKMEDIYIQRSHIPGAGMGAFAGTSIKKDTVIGRYTGETLTLAEYEQRYVLKNREPVYVLQVSEDVLIDASKKRGRHWSAFINDVHLTRKRPNVRFCALGSVKTLRNIKEHEELLVSYGRAYWSRRALK